MSDNGPTTSAESNTHLAPPRGRWTLELHSEPGAPWQPLPPTARPRKLGSGPINFLAGWMSVCFEVSDEGGPDE